MIRKAYKYRLYPNKKQEEFFIKSFGCARFIYNWGLMRKNQEYVGNRKNLSCFDLINELANLKNEKTWLTDVDSQSLQMALRNLDNAFTAFFKKKARFPRLKSKNGGDFSFQLPQRVYLKGNKIKLSKAGLVKIVIDRQFNGKLKTTTISKNLAGQFFVSLSVESNEKPIKPIVILPDITIGIDLGIKNFATLSNGEIISNPKYLKKSLSKLKRIQRRHSKKVKGSNNREKDRIKLAKAHLKVVNQRKDFLHKLTYNLTHKNQVSTYVIEDLAVNNMLRNHNLAQSISDVSWGEFRRQMEYKCLWYGKNLIVIGRFEPSSKLCSNCGTTNENLKLSDREWICDCGAKHDRDLLAANNVKTFGLEQYRRSYGNLNACEDDKVHSVARWSSKKQETLKSNS